MFFYVDESGHTGTNLFDENQPVLYYGILSAKVNLEILAEPDIKKARKQLGVDRLHATELGMRGLAEISEHLISIQKKYQPKFDCYRVAKADHAVICFFDQVFDQGLNPAMTWTGYWTPIRYILLVKIASLFDEDLAKRAWKARIVTTITQPSVSSQPAPLNRRVPHLKYGKRNPPSRNFALMIFGLSARVPGKRPLSFDPPSPGGVSSPGLLFLLNGLYIEGENK